MIGRGEAGDGSEATEVQRQGKARMAPRLGQRPWETRERSRGGTVVHFANLQSRRGQICLFYPLSIKLSVSLSASVVELLVQFSSH